MQFLQKWTGVGFSNFRTVASKLLVQLWAVPDQFDLSTVLLALGSDGFRSRAGPNFVLGPLLYINNGFPVVQAMFGTTLGGSPGIPDLVFKMWIVPVFSDYQPVMEQNLYLVVLKGFLFKKENKLNAPFTQTPRDFFLIP